MNSLVIVESHFGNTWRIGQAVAAAIADATLLRVDQAPTTIADDVSLLILGAPTHAFTLPTADSRKSARARTTPGARAARERGFAPSTSGLREWIARATIPSGAKVLVFDTCVKGAGPLFGRAAARASKRLARNGVQVGGRETFWVTNADELYEGEIARATAWARSL